MFIRDVRRSGRLFPERGCILKHQTFGFAKIILRDRCSNSYNPASLFRGRRCTFDRWSGRSATSLADLLRFLMLSNRKLRKPLPQKSLV